MRSNDSGASAESYTSGSGRSGGAGNFMPERLLYGSRSMGVRAMRTALGHTLLGLLCASSVVGVSLVQVLAQVPSKPPPRTVYLYDTADLDQLRETNFNHYLRARKILAAANEICRPGKETSFYARFDGADPRCLTMLWKTSNPPKKQIEFHLDDVHYVALVTVTDNPAKLLKAEDAQR